VLDSEVYGNDRETQMDTIDANVESAAAILVQTIFLKDGHLQGLLGAQASKSPQAAVEFLRPYYLAVLAMTASARLATAT
jgi:hypothetical protein